MNTNLKLIPGVEVISNSKRYVIKKLLDIDTVLAWSAETKTKQILNIDECTPSADLNNVADRPLEAIGSEQWQKALSRFEVIKPLLEKSNRTRQDVTEFAKKIKLSTATLYRWINRYQEAGLVTALVNRERYDKGSKQLDVEVEKLILELINAEYLTTQKISIQNLFNKIKLRCIQKSLAVPHYNTIRNRIKEISQAKKIYKRKSKQEAISAYKEIQKHFPGADNPLSVVQIDHTKVDLILVDDHYRRPIGRPNITLAIDVFSRMVAGFYISFDPPGALATGLCVAHSILTKEEWLQKHKTNNAWKVWGVPRTLHMDNAKEFRGTMLERACQQYGINIEWRPVGRPNFGGHIERLLGTFMRELHALPGTTFSATQDRKGYDSEKQAAFTLSEFETWLTTYIVDVYHQKVHSSLGMTPVQKYQEGILGNDKVPGIGIPTKVSDETRLRLDFLPFEKRTVQSYGVAIDDIHYWHDILRTWIKTPHEQNRKLKREFIFKRDPRDISTIWFLDPELDTYFAIPYRDTSHPAMSIWELREAKKYLKTLGGAKHDERAIFEAYERLQTIENEAKRKTAAARKAQQRKRHVVPVVKPSDVPPVMSAEKIIEKVRIDVPSIKPFDDLEDLS